MINPTLGWKYDSEKSRSKSLNEPDIISLGIEQSGRLPPSLLENSHVNEPSDLLVTLSKLPPPPVG